MIRKITEDFENQSRIDSTLADMKQKGLRTHINIVWQAGDILGLDDTLSAEEVEAVLNLIEGEHDASIGINWDVIEEWINFVKENR
jgi:hypothetical protein